MGNGIEWLERHLHFDRAAAAQAGEPERKRRRAGLPDAGGVRNLRIGAKPIRRIVEAGIARTVSEAPHGPHGGEKRCLACAVLSDEEGKRGKSRRLRFRKTAKTPLA